MTHLRNSEFSQRSSIAVECGEKIRRAADRAQLLTDLQSHKPNSKENKRGVPNPSYADKTITIDRFYNRIPYKIVYFEVISFDQINSVLSIASVNIRNKI